MGLPPLSYAPDGTCTEGLQAKSVTLQPIQPNRREVVQHIKISVVDSPSDAPNYSRDMPDVRAASITEAIVVDKGTRKRKPTVDLRFCDQDGNKYVAIMSGQLVEGIAAAIVGRRERATLKKMKFEVGKEDNPRIWEALANMNVDDFEDFCKIIQCASNLENALYSHGETSNGCLFNLRKALEGVFGNDIPYTGEESVEEK